MKSADKYVVLDYIQNTKKNTQKIGEYEMIIDAKYEIKAISNDSS